MTPTIDFDAWLAEYGPQSYDELMNLEKVVTGSRISGPYSGAPAHCGSGWHVRRQGMQPLNLSPLARRSAFKDMLWYYRSGKLTWHQEKPKGLEAFFA